MRRMLSGSQKIEARTFPADFCTRNFLVWGGVRRYATTPLIVALSPGQSDRKRINPWSPIAPDKSSKSPRLPAPSTGIDVTVTCCKQRLRLVQRP
jgi:hypothetical protein